MEQMTAAAKVKLNPGFGVMTEALGADPHGAAILAQMRRTEAVPQIERHVQYSIRVQIAEARNANGVTILSNAATNCMDSASTLAMGKAWQANQRASYLRIPGMWMTAMSAEDAPGGKKVYHLDPEEIAERNQALAASVQGLSLVVDAEGL